MDATLNAILNTQSNFVSIGYWWTAEPVETQWLYWNLSQERRHAEELLKRAQEEFEEKELKDKPYIYININKNESTNS